MFLPYGRLERLLMPPAGTIAIIQFRDATSARAAFTKLSYKRFKDGIISVSYTHLDVYKRQSIMMVSRAKKPGSLRTW